jgi:hypothetical protein
VVSTGVCKCCASGEIYVRRLCLIPPERTFRLRGISTRLLGSSSSGGRNQEMGLDACGALQPESLCLFAPAPLFGLVRAESQGKECAQDQRDRCRFGDLGNVRGSKDSHLIGDAGIEIERNHEAVCG